MFALNSVIVLFKFHYCFLSQNFCKRHKSGSEVACARWPCGCNLDWEHEHCFGWQQEAVPQLWGNYRHARIHVSALSCNDSCECFVMQWFMWVFYLQVEHPRCDAPWSFLMPTNVHLLIYVIFTLSFSISCTLLHKKHDIWVHALSPGTWYLSARSLTRNMIFECTLSHQEHDIWGCWPGSSLTCYCEQMWNGLSPGNAILYGIVFVAIRGWTYEVIMQHKMRLLVWLLKVCLRLTCFDLHNRQAPPAFLLYIYINIYVLLHFSAISPGLEAIGHKLATNVTRRYHHWQTQVSWGARQGGIPSWHVYPTWTSFILKNVLVSSW
jgi:hypothetical protein